MAVGGAAGADEDREEAGTIRYRRFVPSTTSRSVPSSGERPGRGDGGGEDGPAGMTRR
jgi:hypothetical protein